MFLTQDAGFLKAFRIGKAEVLQQIYLHYAPELYRYLRRGFRVSSAGSHYRFSGLKDPVEQESFVQETFVRCFSQAARDSYNGKNAYGGYLQSTCRNLLLESWRKNKKYTFVALDESFEQESSEQLYQDEFEQQSLLEAKELQRSLENFLNGCDERERLVFDALYQRSESQQEASSRLEIGRTQLRTSLKKLRKGLLLHFRNTGYLASLEKAERGKSLLVLLLITHWNSDGN